MVKFSKELEAQLIPEWKEAFVNYWQLKKHVKKIKLSRKPIKPSHPEALIKWGLASSTLIDPVRSVVKKIADRFRSSADDNDSVAQVVIRVRSENLEDGQVEDEACETELTKLFNEEHEVRVFFEALDEELNKVNQFYESREREFLHRGEELDKQLQILQDLKRILSERRRRSSSSLKANGNHEGSLSRSPSRRDSDFSSESFDDLLNENSMEALEEEGHEVATLENNGASYMNVTRSSSRPKQGGKPKMGMMKRIPSTTAAGAITALTAMLWDDLVNNKHRRKDGTKDYSMSKKKLQCAEKMIRGAFVELYRGLCLLKNYSSLNLMAFTKILKKFHKVAGPQASTNYLKEVKKSHFVSSDKVIRLMDEVESMFTKHFTNNDRKQAMKFLRPQQQRDSHMVTFFVGLLTGCFVTLFSLYAILAHLTGVFSAKAYPNYVDIVYPVFSAFALFSLHLLMYGCNLFAWKQTRINCNFICEFSPTTALKYRDALLICTASMTTMVGMMVVHLLLRTNGFSSSRADPIPGVLLLVYLLLLVCPFNVFYRPTRYCFIQVIRNIICSPFCKVLMVDFFMADQLTSQIPLLRHMESTACYFLVGSFRTHQYETCKSGQFYRELAYVISFLPYYWRAMQCARRWFDEGDANHLANMGKYVSAMVAAGARLTYARQEGMPRLIVVVVTSTVAMFYQLYWDFIKDWGVLNRRSKNPWLRDDLILNNKSIYFISIALNTVLRFAWVETVLRFRVGVVESHLLDLFLASLEVIRRGHWNFYRLENEHLNNVGKFRAVKMVPLPFREMDSDD